MLKTSKDSSNLMLDLSCCQPQFLRLWMYARNRKDTKLRQLLNEMAQEKANKTIIFIETKRRLEDVTRG